MESILFSDFVSVFSLSEFPFVVWSLDLASVSLRLCLRCSSELKFEVNTFKKSLFWTLRARSGEVQEGMIVQAFVGLSCKRQHADLVLFICFVFYFSSECLIERNLQQLLYEHSARGHTGKNMLKSHLCTITAADCCTLNLMNLLNLWISSLSVCIWNFNKDKVQCGKT